MIELQNVRKSFRTGNVATVALNGLSLTVEQGEYLAIMGPSGCGKTTLLNVLGLLDTADEGRYILDGQDVSKISEHERTLMRRGKIGYVFQSFNLLDELTVAENVELPLVYLNEPPEERTKRVHTRHLSSCRILSTATLWRTATEGCNSARCSGKTADNSC